MLQSAKYPLFKALNACLFIGANRDFINLWLPNLLNMQTIRIRVTGKVQGVYYRQSTSETATQLSIGGNVRNMPDGSVEIKATGTEEQLNQLITWCKIGPAKAKVRSVEVDELDFETFKAFLIIYP